MSKLDPRHARLHKEIYSHFLDELDNEVLSRVMSDPNCEEAVLLNHKVETEIRRRLEESLVTSSLT
jgi:hypothetical protein